MSIQLKPPFNRETAIQKVQSAQNLWNGKNPNQVAMAYTENSVWRNRNEFAQGRADIVELLVRKWNRELDYRLKKDLFAFDDNRIAVNFVYEYRNDSGQWFRAYGLEHWWFADNGLMENREASINELPILEQQRVLD